MTVRIQRMISAAGCAAALGLGGEALASAWGRDEGEVFLISRVERFSAEGDFLPNFENDLPDRFERVEASVYAEYGLTPRWTVGAKAALRKGEALNAAEAQSGDGLSEAEIFAQRRLWRRERDVCAVRITAAALNRFDVGRRQGLVADGPDAELRVLYGRQLTTQARSTFLTVEGAYRRRFSAPADQIRIDAGLGGALSARTLLMVQSLNTLSVRNGDPAGSDYDVYRLQASIVYKIGPRWSLQTGYSRDLETRNIARGDAVFIGVWTRF